MNFILDTHTFLWALFDTQRLSERCKSILIEADNNIYISIITFWEISLKYQLGKITFEGVLPEDLPLKTIDSGFEILDLSVEEVATFHNLPKKVHKDPFDRLLIWQSIKRNFPLVSKDMQLEAYRPYGLKVVW